LPGYALQKPGKKRRPLERGNTYIHFNRLAKH